MMALILNTIQLYNAQNNLPGDFVICHFEVYRLDTIRQLISPSTFMDLSQLLLEVLSGYKAQFWNNLKS
eukprot:UN05700